MFRGRIQRWDLLEWKVDLTATHNRAVTGSAVFGNVAGTIAAGGLTSYHVNNADAKVLGIELGIRNVDTTGNGSAAAILGATRTEAYLKIPALSINSTSTISATTWVSTANNTELIFTNLWLYQDNYAWRLSWTALTWKVNGSTISSGGSGVLALQTKPCSVPLFGIPPVLGATAGLDINLTADPLDADFCTWTDDGVHVDVGHPGGSDQYPANGTSTAEVSADVTGGWRIKVGATYYTFPVTLNPLALPSSFCSPDYELPSATDTYDGAASAHTRLYSENQHLSSAWADPSNTSFVYEVQKTILEFDTNASSVMLLPDLPKGVNRMVGVDYAALIIAGGLPEATSLSAIDCCRKDRSSACASVTDSSDSDTDTRTDFAGWNRRIVRVTNTPHSIEDVFAIPSYAPYGASGARTYATELDLRLKGPGFGTPPTLCYPAAVFIERNGAQSSFPATVSSPSDWFPFLNHSSIGDITVYYISYLVHPNWSFLYYVPNDADANFWKVNGTKEGAAYWLSIREQWMNATGIESGSDTQTRNFLLSFAGVGFWPGDLIQGSGYLGTGALSSWWGISRFQVDNTQPLASVAYTSATSSLWSATNAVLTHGASINVNPSALNCTVDLDIGSISVFPYLYPHLCNRITVGWSGGTITAVSVKLVTPEGDTVELATAPGAYDRPVGAESKFAGSWAQDFSPFGIGFTDTGVDTDADGVSATVMASVERQFAFGLINTRTAGKLRFEFTVSSHATDFTLNYPTFAVQSEDATILVETGTTQDILFPNGPGLRYGIWHTIDEGDLTTLVPPYVSDPGFAMTVTDWLVWKNLVLLAVSETTNLNTNLASVYDSLEYFGLTGDDLRWVAFADTHTFLLPGIAGNKMGHAILVNWQSEWPPLACWPMNTRNADWSLTTGGWTQESWSHAQEPRRIISGGSALNIRDNVTSFVWTTPSAITVPGWYITEHNHIVTNNEMDDFIIVSTDGDIATASPWHGYFATYSAATVVMTPVAAVAFNNQLMVSWIKSAKVKVAVCGTPSYEGFELTQELEPSGVTSRPALVKQNPFRVELRYVVGGNNARRTTTTFARGGVGDWSVSSVPSPNVPPFYQGDANFLTPFTFRPDGAGSIFFSLLTDGRGDAWNAEITAASNALGDTCGGCRLENGGYILLYQKTGGDTMMKKTMDPDTWPSDGAAVDTTLNVPVSGLVMIATNVLFAISYDTTTNVTSGFYSVDNGDTWSTPVAVAEVPNTLESPPALAEDETRLYIAWVDNAENPQFVKSENAGETWA